MTSAAQTVFITVPKFVAISPSNLPKLKPAAVAAATLVNNNNNSITCSNGSTNVEGHPRGKKRRLDHLTWEEKIQRKKLKNRVAAQTSRDRKKARMEEMESEIKELTQKASLLENKCESLQMINSSLLEKNQKLDMEIEMLKQQLNELREENQQRTASKLATCSGCECINGSAAGFTTDAITVDTRTKTERQLSCSLEDCCALPPLQDLLLVDEELDAGKLEELAESLLADITADLDASNRTGFEALAENEGGTERLPGPMVGSATECMESGEHSRTATAQSGQLETDPTNSRQHDLSTQDDTNNGALTLQDDSCRDGSNASASDITIVMDEDVPVNGAVEEIYCEGSESLTQDEDTIKCPTPSVASPSQVYLNVENTICDDSHEDELNFDPITEFLRPKSRLISPLAKSPALSVDSIISDHGYESNYDTNMEDFGWSSTFNELELFPTLI